MDDRKIKALMEAAEPVMKLNPASWHHCDVKVRRNGEDERHEGDWLKDLWYALRWCQGENVPHLEGQQKE